MSYGFTNFTWIWLWLSKDKHLFEWSFLILMWWFVCPFLTKTFEPTEISNIVIQRTTGEYHGYMALILFIGYLGVIIYNFAVKDPKRRVNIPWILAIGVLVQFGWEAGLLLGGIRSAGFSASQKISTIIVNSLLETNLGMPYVYFIFAFLTSRFTERFSKREKKLSLSERIEENNLERVRER